MSGWSAFEHFILWALACSFYERVIMFLSNSMCTLLESLGQSVGACPGKLVGWVCSAISWQKILRHWNTEVICMGIAMATLRDVHHKYVKIFSFFQLLYSPAESRESKSPTHEQTQCSCDWHKFRWPVCDQLQYSYINIFDQLVLTASCHMLLNAFQPLLKSHLFSIFHQNLWVYKACYVW